MKREIEDADTFAFSASSEAVMSFDASQSLRVTPNRVLRIRNERKNDLRMRKVTENPMECHSSDVGRPTTSPLSAFGLLLQPWLDRRGMSKLALADRAGVDVTSITHWTRVGAGGTSREPGYTKVARICRALDITVDQLLSGAAQDDTFELSLRDREVRLVLAYRDKKRKRFRHIVDSELENE